MLMVVFGAGATHDSSPDFPPSGKQVIEQQRPPLTDALFANSPHNGAAVTAYPQCLGIISQLKSSADRTVEEGLKEFWADRFNNHIRISQIAAIRFYLRDVIKGFVKNWNAEVARRQTNYMTLLDQINACVPRAQEVLLVTFNYDTLLEDAMAVMRCPVTTMEDYTAHDRFKLVKLHGSVDWMKPVVDGPCDPLNFKGDEKAMVKQLIENAHALKFGTKYKKNRERTWDGSERKIWFPAISIPLAEKNSVEYYECPRSQLDILERLTPEVTHILTVGWAAGDTHFLDDLKKKGINQNAVRLCSVAQDEGEAGEVETAIKARLPGIKYRGQKGKGGFTDFAQQQQGSNFFRSLTETMTPHGGHH